MHLVDPNLIRIRNTHRLSSQLRLLDLEPLHPRNRL